MKEIECPEYSALAAFQDCIPIKRSKDLRARLTCISGEISNAEVLYKEKAKTHAFHEIAIATGVGSCISTKEMEDLYENVFARKTSVVREKYYDELILLPVNGTCPMCGQRDVSTLDHYLPKAKNPSLSVTPVNLVATCSNCNHTKSEFHPVTADEQFIHPYYDNLPEQVWLIADLEESNPPALNYKVITPEGCDEVLAARMIWHFAKLNLAKLYTSQAGNFISGISHKLINAWERGGSTEVRFVLDEDAASWSKCNKNGWQAAMFRALANSVWFCEEGYAYTGEKRKRTLD